MKPTQQRTEGEMLAAEREHSFYLETKLVNQRNTITALELELERAKGWLRNALMAAESETRPGGGLSSVGRIIQSALRDLGEGQ